MTIPKSMIDLRDELSAYLRGEIPRPDWMKVEKKPLPDIVGVLTPGNMALMRLIANKSPATVAELAEMADRAPHEVARDLQDLARVGFVRLVRDGMSIPPELAAHEARLDLERNMGICLRFETQECKAYIMILCIMLDCNVLSIYEAKAKSESFAELKRQADKRRQPRGGR